MRGNLAFVAGGMPGSSCSALPPRGSAARGRCVSASCGCCSRPASLMGAGSPPDLPSRPACRSASVPPDPCRRRAGPLCWGGRGVRPRPGGGFVLMSRPPTAWLVSSSNRVSGDPAPRCGDSCCATSASITSPGDGGRSRAQVFGGGRLGILTQPRPSNRNTSTWCVYGPAYPADAHMALAGDPTQPWRWRAFAATTAPTSRYVCTGFRDAAAFAHQPGRGIACSICGGSAIRPGWKKALLLQTTGFVLEQPGLPVPDPSPDGSRHEIPASAPLRPPRLSRPLWVGAGSSDRRDAACDGGCSSSTCCATRSTT